MIETILGSSGIIGTELAKELSKYGNFVNLVSRNPKPIVGDEMLYGADLTDKKNTFEALKGSDIAYLTVGLEYDTKVWQSKWPVIMSNVIEACKYYNTKLVFFDNVYPYGKVDGWMREDTPYNPCSKKGIARAEVAKMLESAIKSKEITALIARSADFYGVDATKTFAMPMIFDKYKSGKKASWLINKHQPHSMTYVKDIVKALAVLAHDEKAYSQTWHLPTDKNAPTGEEFMRSVAKAYGVEPNSNVLPIWMLKIVGLFDKVVKETKEMAYQFNSPYLFDSSKFENRYFKATPYKEAIAEIVAEYR